MDRANRITCPHCSAPLKSTRGIRIGRKIKCLKCEVPFTVRPEDAELAAGVNGSRMGVVLVGTLLYLLGGTALAYYCFTQNSRKSEKTTVADAQQPDDTDDAATSSPFAQGLTVTVAAVEQRKIDNAIANGVWYLKEHALPSGTWVDAAPANQVGFASLPALTLLECGVPADDPIVQKAVAFVRNQVFKQKLELATYERSLAILFLDRLGDKQDEELIQRLALCLIAGQDPIEGAWHYRSPGIARKLVPQLLEMLKDDKVSLEDWRKTALNGKTFDPGGWDNSNTQFAVLALWVARRHHVACDKSLALVEKHFRNTQQPSGADPRGDNLNLDGSWLYDGGQNSSAWPSMTCAGLLTLAIAHGVNADQKATEKPLDDPAVKKAFAMLSREIARPGEKRGPDLYFLWSLERVGVLFNLPKIEDKDWYAWGCGILLPLQQPDGNWQDGNYYGSTPVLDTSFALLFLKQANLARDLSSKLQLLATKK